MKRTVQMATCGIPSGGLQKTKFKGYRGVGSQTRRKTFLEVEGHSNNWRAGEILLIADYRKKHE